MKTWNLGQTDVSESQLDTTLASIAGIAGKSTGKKFDDGKHLAAIIPPQALIEVSKVLTFGARKYGRHNYRTLPDLETRYQDALMRHTYDYLSGNKIDEESGLSELAHMAANIFILMDCELEIKKIAEENTKLKD